MLNSRANLIKNLALLIIFLEVMSGVVRFIQQPGISLLPLRTSSQQSFATPAGTLELSAQRYGQENNRAEARK